MLIDNVSILVMIESMPVDHLSFGGIKLVFPPRTSPWCHKIGILAPFSSRRTSENVLQRCQKERQI